MERRRPQTVRSRAVGAFLLVPFVVALAPGGCGGVALEKGGSGGTTSIGGGSSVAGAGGAASGAGHQRDAQPLCKSALAECSNSGECCEGYCWGGLCQRPGCALPAGRCGTTDDCCAPTGSVVCLQGLCVAWGTGVPDPPNGVCRTVTLACTTDSECCDGYCLDSICQPPACARQDAPCAAVSDCCRVTALLIRCNAGICITVTGH
jgi:hypothetical protein